MKLYQKRKKPAWTVNGYQTISDILLHSPQTVKYMNLEHKKESAKPHLIFDMQSTGIS